MSCEQSIVRLFFLAISCGFFLISATSPAISRAAENRPGMRTEGEQIFLETNHLAYVVGTNGLNVAFRDRRNEKNYLDTSEPTPFMRVSTEKGWIDSVSVELARGFLFVTFRPPTGPPIMAKIHPRTFPNYLTLELTAINDHTIGQLQLANLPTTLTDMVTNDLTSTRNNEYAAAVIPANIETRSYNEGKPLLIAFAERDVRLEGSKIAVLGCPTNLLLDILEQVEVENGLPHPTIDGVWARKSPEMKMSYLFVDIGEANADAMIDYAKAGGFHYIVAYNGTWNQTYGTVYRPHPNHYPSGEAGLLAVSDKIHAAGLKFGMHIINMCVDKGDPAVHGKPDPGLLTLPHRRRILAQEIGPDDTFIPTSQSPQGLLAKGEKSVWEGFDLWIDDEIIIYEDIQINPPGFIGCRRGAHGTTAAAHKAGMPIDNLVEFIDAFYHADVGSDLYDRVARANAEALDKYKFDFIYPENVAISIVEIGRSRFRDVKTRPRWYSINLMIAKLYHYTKREVMFAHGPSSNLGWHIFSRGNTVDFVQSGIMAHFDHNSLSGVPSQKRNMQPFEFGWFGYFTDSPAGKATRPREMEYAWSKALAYGAAMSLETHQAALDDNGRTGEIFSGIRNWEELKLADYFPESIREQMQVPRREFTLERAGDEKWNVRPVTYGSGKHVGAVDGKQNIWEIQNQYGAQPLRVSIEVRSNLTNYGESANVVLIEPASSLKLKTTGNGPFGGPHRDEGVSFDLKPTAIESPGGGKSLEVTAVNKGERPHGWGCVEVILDGVQDLTEHRALGVWVDGDGSGANLHFTLEDSGRWQVRDFYVPLDFKGWKYVEIPKWAQGEVYDFHFPFSNYTALRGMSFDSVARMYVFLTNIPVGGSVRARFSRLEALREMTPRTVHNPGLTVNGKSITFPVAIEPSWYLEYAGAGPVRVFDANGFTKAEVMPEGPAPSLQSGNNSLTFFCDRGPDFGETVEVTPITRGKPLR